MQTIKRPRPYFTPPEPPTSIPNAGGGDDGGFHRLPWWAWFSAFLLVAATGWGAYAVLGVGFNRPWTFVAGFLSALAAAWLSNGIAWSDSDRFYGRVYASGIAGGVVGELMTYLIVGVPASVPQGIAWLAIGAGGIGGAIGIGLAIYVSLAWLVGRLIHAMWRDHAA